MEYYFGMFLGLFGICYLLFYGISLWFISREVYVDKKDEKNQIYAAGISVIVPFKNEVRHLKNLIHSLSSQTLVNDQVEFILVNDHSTDNSQELAKQCIPNHFFTLLSLPINLHGKKQAIKHGIEHSQFDWILTTDADCTHPDNWLSEMSKQLSHEQVAMRIGQVSYPEPKNLLETLVSYESTLLSYFHRKMYFMQRPVLASGANLLFSKKALNAIGGYDPNMDIASGDDIFLLHQFKQKLGAQFIDYQETKVTTCYPETWSSFFKQRIRWAGKAKYYKDQDSILSGIWIGLLYALYAIISSLFIIKGFWILLAVFYVSMMLIHHYYLKFPIKKSAWICLLYPFISLWIILVSFFYAPTWE